MDQNVEIIEKILYCKGKKRNLEAGHHIHGNIGGNSSTKRGAACLAVTASWTAGTALLGACWAVGEDAILGGSWSLWYADSVLRKQNGRGASKIVSSTQVCLAWLPSACWLTFSANGSSPKFCWLSCHHKNTLVSRADKSGSVVRQKVAEVPEAGDRRAVVPQ